MKTGNNDEKERAIKAPSNFSKMLKAHFKRPQCPTLVESYQVKLLEVYLMSEHFLFRKSEAQIFPAAPDLSTVATKVYTYIA